MHSKLLRNEVVTLIEEEKQPGVYAVEFNSKGLSSGVYCCHLKAGSYNQTKKMMLIK